jgi:hypothetical protein
MTEMGKEGYSKSEESARKNFTHRCSEGPVKYWRRTVPHGQVSFRSCSGNTKIERERVKRIKSGILVQLG